MHNPDVLHEICKCLPSNYYSLLHYTSRACRKASSLLSSTTITTDASFAVTSVERLRWALGQGRCTVSTERLKLFSVHCGCLESLQLLVSMNPSLPLRRDHIRMAIARGHLHILQWFATQYGQLEPNPQYCNYAARHGQLQILAWLYEEQKMPMREWACVYAAALEGHLHVIKWLSLEKCCELYPWTPPVAARNGHTDIVSWLRDETDCPWDEAWVLSFTKLASQ